jgi:DnaJ-class molecular chaperone
MSMSMDEIRVRYDRLNFTDNRCPGCGGSGRSGPLRCPQCNGSGKGLTCDAAPGLQ